MRDHSARSPAAFTRYQKWVVAILAFLQFTIILDFMILSPLGAILIPRLGITPAQFGWVVSVYAFSAGASGLLAAGFADRFDRKKILLFFYAGFLLGTLLCGLAPGYRSLVFARLVTGLFGGVIGSITLAIATDLFPLEMRGRVMGIVQTAFAASQVMGIPLGLLASNRWGWHAPFLMIVAVGALVGGLMVTVLKPVNAHLKLRLDKNPFHHLVSTISNPRYLQGFAAMALLSTGGFMMMPFSSAFNVHNLGIPLEKLPLLYIATGICSIVAGPYVGRLSDRIGKFWVFCGGTALSIAMVLIYTQLGPSSLPLVTTVSIFMFIGISSRMISSSALISAVPKPADRGAFMSVNSSIQQISGGLATALAGLIVVAAPDGSIRHFDRLGGVVILAMIATVVMMRVIDGVIRRS